jgi:hypothetical protein
MRTPYTYLIGWPELDRWYYGLRFAKNCHPDEFWVKYFTSSDVVDSFVKEHGAPSVREIRRTFGDSQVKEAREFEHRVLRRMKVLSDSRWLNKSTSKSIPPMFGDENPMKLPGVREIHKRRVKEAHNTPTAKENHSRAALNRTPETKARQKESAKRAHNTPTAKENHSRAALNRTPETKVRHKESAKKAANAPHRLEKMRGKDNPNNIKVCCVICKKESPLPLLKTNHRKCFQHE